MEDQLELNGGSAGTHRCHPAASLKDYFFPTASGHSRPITAGGFERSKAVVPVVNSGSQPSDITPDDTTRTGISCNGSNREAPRMQGGLGATQEVASSIGPIRDTGITGILKLRQDVGRKAVKRRPNIQKGRQAVA